MDLQHCCHHPPRHQGRQRRHRLKTKLSFNWIGPFKILAVGPAPASAVPDGGLFMTSSSTSTSPPTCPDATPNTASPLFAASLAGTPTTSTTYPSTFLLTSSNTCSTPSTKSPPLHVTLDDISPTPERLEVEQITGHQLVRSRGGVLAALYETRWAGFLSPSWERERDLQHHRLHILRYWTGTPSQHRHTNRLYRQMRIGAANHELSRSRGERFLSPGYCFVPRTLWLRSFSSLTLPAEVHLWYKARNGLWWLGKIANRAPADTSSADSYIVRSLDDPGPIKINLLPSAYTTSRSAAQGSWCLQRHQTGGLSLIHI